MDVSNCKIWSILLILRLHHNVTKTNRKASVLTLNKHLQSQLFAFTTGLLSTENHNYEQTDQRNALTGYQVFWSTIFNKFKINKY